MVRCEEFYRHFEKKGNFCNKSEEVVKKVEEYIEYVRRNRIGTYKISNCALDPFINIEFVNGGIVHRSAMRKLKSLLKNGKTPPEKITRRMSIEIISEANTKIGKDHQLDHIPGIRKRMGVREHEIGEIGYEIRTMFDALKKDLEIRSNNQAMKIMLELSIRNPEEVRNIKEEIEHKEDKKSVKIVETT